MDDGLWWYGDTVIMVIMVMILSYYYFCWLLDNSVPYFWTWNQSIQWKSINCPFNPNFEDLQFGFWIVFQCHVLVFRKLIFVSKKNAHILMFNFCIMSIFNIHNHFHSHPLFHFHFSHIPSNNDSNGTQKLLNS